MLYLEPQCCVCIGEKKMILGAADLKFKQHFCAEMQKTIITPSN